MSILLLDPPEAIGDAVVTRLIQEGDEVRVVERNPPRAGRWRQLGAHVAPGDPRDEDLVERAALNCQSVVVFTSDAASIGVAIAGARSAGVDRVIVVSDRTLSPPDGIDTVVLVARTGLLRRAVAPADVARAVSAADDMAQVPGEPVDLKDVRGWNALGLEGP